jgi:endogenous inhibitor of DNA gyrase (YacG/DUF329 family)
MTDLPNSVNLQCAQCGEPFEAPRKRGGRHLGFCSEKCRAAAAIKRAQRYRREGRYLRAAKCAVCGGKFETAYRRSRTCSWQCTDTLLGRNVRKAARDKKAVRDLFDKPSDDPRIAFLNKMRGG